MPADPAPAPPGPAVSDPPGSAGPVPDRRDGVLRLPDGRLLGYAEYGDPAGPPLLYFHGYPSSRLEAGLIPLHHVRLIAPDRPGYGLSAPKPGRRLLDWPADVAALLDHLGLARAAVLGMSGGGPYAAVCAHALPDRVTATAIVCGIAPPDGEGDGTGERPEDGTGDGPGKETDWAGGSPAGFLLRLGRRPVALRLAAAAVRQVVRSTDPLAVATMLRARAGLPASDRVLLGPGVGDRVVAGWREALRSGIAGPLSDAAIYAAPWGFALEDIRGRVAVWHGTADTTVPLAAGRRFAARIPGATAHFLAGEGHFSLIFRHHPAILTDLLGADRPA
ncbi:alpha/beta fold hydrolase [Rhodospirillum centenum]|uniref:AB hydrolase-1 domain-containing protein n=1 Tax=Rhodospirillum centenum (strain ATCC 51521 / SW) TaxID=414684 RepID=B6IWN1_RHOCS|nr:alpha/beta hydrolase [Rhodospirillum centenum]ACJ00705.1 conserved hypothetical protein [Rhodospirillum centenum SW]